MKKFMLKFIHSQALAENWQHRENRALPQAFQKNLSSTSKQTEIKTTHRKAEGNL